MKLLETFGGSTSSHSSPYDVTDDVVYTPDRFKSIEDWYKIGCTKISEMGRKVDTDCSTITNFNARKVAAEANEMHLFWFLSWMPKRAKEDMLKELNNANPSFEKDLSVWRPEKMMEFYRSRNFKDINNWKSYWIKEAEANYQVAEKYKCRSSECCRFVPL